MAVVGHTKTKVEATLSRRPGANARLDALSALLKSRLQRGLVFTVATLVASVLATNANITPVHIAAPLATLLSTLAVYIMNDIADIKVDRINAPHRPLASGLVKRSEAFALVSILSVGSIVLAAVINPLAVAMVGAYLLIGVLYSMPKVSLKDRFVVKTLAIAIGGLLTSLLGSSVAGEFGVPAVVTAVSFLSLIFVSSPINDLADYEGDKKGGRKTIPIVIGPRNTVIIALILPFAIAAAFWLQYGQWGASVALPVAMTAVAVFALLVIRPIIQHLDDYKYVRKRHKKVVLIHFGLQLALLAGMLNI